MEETRKQAVKAWGKILPFGAQVVASAAAYSVGITATQVSGSLACCSGWVGLGAHNIQALDRTEAKQLAEFLQSNPGTTTTETIVLY